MRPTYFFTSVTRVFRTAAVYVPIFTGLIGCDDPRISAAKIAVNSTLIDPDSSEYSQFTVDETTNRVCGYVNAKNRAGGYAGRHLFIYNIGDDSAFIRDFWTDNMPLPNCVDREFKEAIGRLHSENVSVTRIRLMFLVDDVVCAHVFVEGAVDGLNMKFDIRADDFTFVSDPKRAIARHNLEASCMGILRRAREARGTYYSEWRSGATERP